MPQGNDTRSDPAVSMPMALNDLLAAGDRASVDYALRQCRHGPMLFNRRDIYIGRSLAEYGEYSEAEIAVLLQLVRPGSVIVEAGSNIGALTVPLARATGPSGRVYAYEPQRLQFQILCANLALNGLYNVVARQEALGNATGELRVPVLPPDHSLNFGGLSLESGEHGESVPVGTVDALGLSRLSLLKADVEGMEQLVLEGGRETIARLRPALYVECDRRDRSAALIELILSFDYRAFWHSPAYFNPDNFAGRRENIFGSTASLNLVAMPGDRVGAVDLPPVKGPDDWPSWVSADARPAPPAR